MKIKKSAFTLAEVIMVLGIIGVVSAITIPNLSKSVDKDKYVSLGGNDLPCQACFKRKCKLKNNKNACTYIPTAEDVIETIKGMGI